MRLNKDIVSITGEKEIAWAKNIEWEFSQRGEPYKKQKIKMLAIYPYFMVQGTKNAKDYRAIVFKDLDTGELIRSWSLFAFFEDGSPMSWTSNIMEKVDSVTHKTKAWKGYEKFLREANLEDREYSYNLLRFKFSVFDTFVPVTLI